MPSGTRPPWHATYSTPSAFPTHISSPRAWRPAAKNHAKVTGNLTLHGVTRPVTLDVTLNALKRHPLPPFRRTAGFSATATLRRSEFGIDAWKSVIGDSVELRIEAEAVRQGRADDETPEPQAAPTTPDTAASKESGT